MPKRYPSAPAGKFTMGGWKGGKVLVEIRKAANGRISYVSAEYTGFTDDDTHIIDGTESAELVMQEDRPRIVWHSDLHSSGAQIGTKKTSEPGGFVVSPLGEPLEGTLVTKLNGKVYNQPNPGT